MPFGNGPINQTVDNWRKVLFRIRLGAARAPADSANDTRAQRARNNGPAAEKWVGKFRQPLSAGIVSMVYSTEEPFCENDVYRNAAQDPTLDRILAVRTESMIAVPLYFARECRGVISCVRLGNSDSVTTIPEGFTMESMHEIILASTVLSSLFDYKLLSGVLGWERF